MVDLSHLPAARQRDKDALPLTLDNSQRSDTVCLFFAKAYRPTPVHRVCSHALYKTYMHGCEAEAWWLGGTPWFPFHTFTRKQAFQLDRSSVIYGYQTDLDAVRTNGFLCQINYVLMNCFKNNSSN